MYEQIARNKRRTFLMLAVFVLLIAAVAVALGFFFKAGVAIVPIAIVIAIAMAWTSYFASDRIALAASRAKPADGPEYARYHNLVEGLCIAAHQAMQAALPVIASSAGELAFSVTPQVGGVVPPGAAGPLADALAALLSRPDLLAGMGRTARAWALARFSAEAFHEAGTAVLDRLDTIVRNQGGRSARRSADRSDTAGAL